MRRTRSVGRLLRLWVGDERGQVVEVEVLGVLGSVRNKRVTLDTTRAGALQCWQSLLQGVAWSYASSRLDCVCSGS